MNTKIRIVTFCWLWLALQPAVCLAQEWREHFGGEAALLSSYVYRGMKLADPTGILMVHYVNGGFKAMAETGVAFDGQYMETMLGVSYTLGQVTMEVRDLFFPVYQGVPALSYFNWDPTETSHQSEVIITYKPKKVPLKVLWSTYFAGYDLRYSFDELGNFQWGSRAFSSYLELTAHHTFPHMHTIAATVGASVNRGLYTAYQQDFAVVNTRLSYMKTWLWRGLYPTAGAYVCYNPYLNEIYPVVFLSASF